MRIAPLCRRPFRLTLAVLSFLVAGIAAHAQTTSFSGTVYSPLGAAQGNPIPNILVFVEDPGSPAPVTFDKGISVPGGSCAQQPSLVPNSVLGNATSKFDGTFSFNVAGTLPSTVNLFIQAGKWRLKLAIPKTVLAEGGSNSGFVLSMPSQAGAGTFTYNGATIPTTADLPTIAVVTGTADDVECIFPQIGISAAEVTDPTGTGHINLFGGTGNTGQIVSATSPTEAQLVNPNATGAIPITNYDLVIFGCQGPAGRTESSANNSAYLANVEAYANSGGRIFGTHWEIPWVNSPSDWSPLSTFTSSTDTSNKTLTGQLATTGNYYTGEPTIAAWMKYIGALDVNANLLEFSLTNVFPENLSAVNAPAQIWENILPNSIVNATTPNQFSFDTPIGAAGQPTATLNFTNTTNVPNTFLTGDPNDIVTVAVSNTSAIATTGTLTLTLTVPTVINIKSVQDVSGGGFICTGAAPTYTCTLATALQGGASDSVAITFSIPPTGVQLGTYSVKGVITGGGLNQNSQCGRVLYNDYHVENSVSAKVLWNNGTRCSTSSLTTAQKFLEYSLYNLSSFVAPANSDTIQIQQSSTISWVPPTPVYYGTTIAQIEDGSVNTPGTTTWSFTPTGTDLLDPNTYSFTLKFAPTDSTDYLPSNSTQSVTVLKDPTVAAIDSLDTSIYYGEEIGYNNGVDATLDLNIQPNLPNLLTYPTLTGGTETLTIDGTPVCTATAGTPIGGGSRPGACPDTGFLGWQAGPHTLHFTYAGTKDFAASDYTATVLINADPTLTSLTTNANGTSVLGDNIQYTGTVGNTIADSTMTPAGTLTFYDSSTSVAAGNTPPGNASVIGSVATTTGTGSISLAILPVGTHNIFVCFAAPLNSAGYLNFGPSCSASKPQTVTAIPVTPEGTAVTLISSVNPSPVGNSVTFTATVETTGAITVVPAGTLTFYDNGASIGVSSLTNGVATLTTTSLAVGTHPITASFAATTTLAASTSSTLNEVIVSGALGLDTGFLLRVNPVTIPIFVGSTATATVQVIALTNFTEPVKLTCTGLPAQSACTFAQSTIPAGGGTTTLILSSGAPHDCGNGTAYFAGFGGRGTLALLSLSTLTLCLARRRRKLQAIALTVMLLTLPGVLAGCSNRCTDFAVKPGDYAFNITATSTGSTATSHSQDMVMHVTLQ